MPPLLLQDTSVLINLLATDRFGDISRSTRWQFAICSAVRSEAKSIWNPDIQQRENILLAPLISSGSLFEVDLNTDEERDAHVRLCSMPGVGEGEAMCIALAQSRGLEFATDDQKATRVCLAAQPPVKSVSTPEVLMNWQKITALPEAEMGVALIRIERRARFSPGPHHTHFTWWQKQKLAVLP